MNKREQAISTIEALYPIDSEYLDTNAIAEKLILQAIGENDWRKLPDEILFRYAELCQMQENKEVNEFLKRNLPIIVENDVARKGYRWWSCGEIRIGCGGTHPYNTSEIGQISLKCEKSGSGKIKIKTTILC